MSPRLGLLLLPSLALLAGAGCKNEPPSPEDDRTVARLKAEADREAAQPQGDDAAKRKPTPDAVNAALNDTLAQIAAHSKQEKEAREEARKLPLPDPNPSGKLGHVSVTVTGLGGGHSETNGKLTLSTEELFLRVKLDAWNAGTKVEKLDWSFARVKDDKGGEHPVARDVQRLAGTRELQAEFSSGERREFVLYFEVPPDGPGKGWSLVLPAAVGGEEDVSIPLG